MNYLAAPTRYDSMPYRRCGRSGLQLPAISARAVEQLRRRPPARDPARRAAAGIRPRRHPLRPRQQLRPAARLGRDELRPHLPRGLPPLPRRADHLDEGRLRHVARARTASGARASTCWRASTRACSAWGSTTSTSSTRTASTRTRRSRRRSARVATAVQQGKALYAGISSYSGAKTARGGAHPARPRHAAPDPPAVLLDAQPLDRGGPARRARARGRGLRSCSRRWPRACSPTSTWTASRRTRARRRTASSRRASSSEDNAGPHPRAERDRRARAVSRSPRWRSPGCCATRA